MVRRQEYENDVMKQEEKLRNEIAQMERDKEATIRAVRAEDKRRHADKVKKYKEELDSCQKKMGVLELDKQTANRQLEAERDLKQLDEEDKEVYINYREQSLLLTADLYRRV